jgi:hypothetical protein
MLNALMDEIKKGGTLEVTQLAQKLNTTPQLVTMMLENLQSGGFLKTYQVCSDGCSGCQLSMACSHQKGNGVTQLWQFESDKGITEKRQASR